MYKTFWMFRRNPALTREEFIDYYETKHSKFAEILPGATKYFRRYTVPMDNLAGASDQAPLEFDCIMELWFENREAYDAAFKNVADNHWQDVVEDEKKVFDRGSVGWMMTMIIDEEHETDLSSPDYESTYVSGVGANITPIAD